MSTPKIEILVDTKPRLGEGPLWDPVEGRLYFIDSLGDRIFSCREDGSQLRTFEVPGHIGSMALRADGSALIALQNGFHFFDFARDRAEFIVDPEADKPNTRLNDGKVDLRGRFICGSMDMQEENPVGALWQLDAGLRLSKLDDGIICSNGPCFSPSGDRLYFADSFEGKIRRYDYDQDSGKVTNRHHFADFDTSRGGAPDGATVDEEGYIWWAGVFDGRVFRFDPDGRVDRVIEFPVVKITSLCFGGDQLDTLFVTSMAHPPLPKYPGDGPQRGSVFALRDLGVRGLPEPRFAG